MKIDFLYTVYSVYGFPSQSYSKILIYIFILKKTVYQCMGLRVHMCLYTGAIWNIGSLRIGIIIKSLLSVFGTGNETQELSARAVWALNCWDIPLYFNGSSLLHIFFWLFYGYIMNLPSPLPCPWSMTFAK